jgi:outer membrane autotransporter protein
VSPFLALQYLHMSVDSFNETLAKNTITTVRFRPAAGANLAVDSMDDDSFRTRLGARFNYHAQVRRGLAIAAEARIAWQHEYINDNNGITATFINSGLSSFTVDTNNPQEDAALLGVGLNATFCNRVTVFADYDAQVGTDDYVEQNAKTGLRFSF